MEQVTVVKWPMTKGFEILKADVLQDKCYVHFYINIDGLIINLISLVVQKADLNKSNKFENFFLSLLDIELLQIDTIKNFIESHGELRAFSTIEGDQLLAKFENGAVTGHPKVVDLFV